MDKTTLARLTAEVVTSYVGNPSISEGELDRAIERLPLLIDRVHEALRKIITQNDELPEVGTAETRGATAELNDVQEGARDETALERLREPAVSIETSLSADHLICLEDGLSFKTLARHLKSTHGLTPEQYRARWGLPPDYPMACGDYAEARSMVARRIGLGVEGRGSKPAFMASGRQTVISAAARQRRGTTKQS